MGFIDQLNCFCQVATDKLIQWAAFPPANASIVENWLQLESYINLTKLGSEYWLKMNKVAKYGNYMNYSTISY